MATIFQFLIILIFLPTIFNNSTDSYRVMNTEGKVLQSQQFTCFQLFSLPMTTLLYADYYGYLCSSDYFIGCKQQFLAECYIRRCDTSTLPFWIDTFPNTAKDFICGNPFSDIDNIHKNGGSDCLNKIVIDPQVYNLVNSVYYGQTINCRDMDKYMHNVLNELDKCSYKGLRTLVAQFLYKSVANSICHDQIIIEGGSGSSTNITGSFLFCILSMIASLIIGSSYYW